MNGMIPNREPVSAYGIGQEPIAGHPSPKEPLEKIMDDLPKYLFAIGLVVLIDLLLTDEDKGERSILGKVKRAVTGR